MKRNVWQRLRDAYKSIFNDAAFGRDTGYASGFSGQRWWTPGSNLNWEELAGDLWLIPGVAACLDYEFRNFLQAPPVVYREAQEEDEEEEIVPRHPLTGLLHTPNDEYDLNVLLMGCLLSWECKGDVYIGIDRRRRVGLPESLWYIPHHLITPKRDKQTRKIYYEYRIAGKRERLESDEVIHIRRGLNPYNLLEGFSPLQTFARDGYVLQQGSTYSAKAMRNAGLVGGLVTPPDNALDPANASVEFDPEEFVKLHTDKVTGDRAGEILAWNHPLKVQWPNVTPQNMAVDTMLDRPEAIVCALLGIPAQCVGLHVGRLSKTYANVAEAREIAWEEKILPTGLILYGGIGAALLPQVSRNAESERLGMDVRQVRPLQPDLDKLYERANAAWELNLIDRATWKRMVGLKPEPGDEGLYFRDASVPEGHAEQQDIGQARRTFRERMNARRSESGQKYNPNHDPRNGQFTSGGGGAGAAGEDGGSELSERAQLAKQHAVLTDAQVQRYTEGHCEPHLARALGGRALLDNEPVDVVATLNGQLHGVELKTKVQGGQDKIEMKKSAQQRKADWAQENNATVHTVVYDDRKLFNANGPGQHGPETDRVIKYKRGYGTMQLGNMYKVSSMEELRRLIAMPDADLPPAARAGTRVPARDRVPD